MIEQGAGMMEQGGQAKRGLKAACGIMLKCFKIWNPHFKTLVLPFRKLSWLLNCAHRLEGNSQLLAFSFFRLITMGTL